MNEIICPSCKNLITDDEVLLCHFCGESLNRSSSGALGKINSGDFRIWFVILVIILIFGFIWIRM